MPPLLNIIHLPHREDRLQSFMEQCNQQNIAYNEIRGETSHKKPVTNISRAHKGIVRTAKITKQPHVFIAEDDIKFACDGAWKYFLSKMPKDFDLYCGLVYDGNVVDGRIMTTKGMSGTNTLYCVNSRFYDFFLSIDETKPLDRELGRFSTKYKYIVCEPMVCVQSGGYSDNFKRKMTYELYLSGKKLLNDANGNFKVMP